MEIEWDWSSDDEFLGEKLPADTLDRKKYAQYLYQISAARGEKSNLVINLNAEWGAGKTYFTKRLAKTISESHPTIYIDAWKEDFSDDPLLTVFGSIKEQLSGQSDQFTQMMDKAIDNIGPLLKSATPAILAGLAKKYTGVDNISDITKTLSTKLMQLHSEKSKKITTIRSEISEWVRYIKQKDGINKELPLFIIIDELDRCRPNFAIKLLEITKHIFNIPGVVFIIATDTEQLQHSIKVIYGNEFSANHYLNRFFDRRFQLPNPEMTDFLKTISAGSFSDDFLDYRKKMSPCPPGLSEFIYNCASVLEALRINLRESIKLYQRLLDAIIISKKNLDPIFLLILSAINIKHNEFYTILKGNRSNKNNMLFLDESVELSFDVSRGTTGVTSLRGTHGISGRYTNEYKIKTITSSLSEYINSAQAVILTSTPASEYFNEQYPEPWVNGGLIADNSLDTLLKMGWASTKSYETSLTLSQYYDLIELSTTFE
ncbi:P-loop NTPase fold protein [Citrobacter sp. S2-9]|uniref:P-loop NTPase fold protein n=1 Tax=Citrobacter enshiensis TaxID=2971264 RepID=A0ABT8PNJ9_9ENTR|nr:P-loop NTPase fold protein [Citrobacter enshiensis]MDN8597900.1 P-loop NTPase fold protein [Citrobacter enshiensis]